MYKNLCIDHVDCCLSDICRYGFIQLLQSVFAEKHQFDDLKSGEAFLSNSLVLDQEKNIYIYHIISYTVCIEMYYMSYRHWCRCVGYGLR